MTSQRVCIIRRYYYPTESHVRRNAETLLSADYSVDVICLRGKDQLPFEIVDGVKVHRVSLRARRAGILWYLFEYVIFSILAFIKVTWLHLREPFAVVEVDSMPDFLVFASLVPKLLGAKIILYLFESMPELWAQKTGKPMDHWSIRLISWQEYISCLYADFVICCHEMARNALVKMGVPEEKVLVILNVPDERMFPQRSITVTGSDNGKNRMFNIIQHGTITDNYGIQVVIKALKIIDQNIPIMYNVLGRGEYQSTLEEIVKELGLQERVTFHGYISRERMMEMLCNTDIGIVPMLFEYQSPNKLFELVALGIPVIASDLKTLKQHFTDDEILYFRSGDSEDLAEVIIHAVQNPEYLRRHALEARQNYQNIRWGIMKKRYLDLYSKLAQMSH